MKVEIKVPPLGESVSEATIANFIKPNGSIVKTDEEIIELETEKVNQVLYAPESGQISWQVTQGETVKVGQSLGYVDTDVKGEAAKQEAPKQQPKQEPQKEAPAPQPSGETCAKDRRRSGRPHARDGGCEDQGRREGCMVSTRGISRSSISRRAHHRRTADRHRAHSCGAARDMNSASAKRGRRRQPGCGKQGRVG